MIKKFEVIYTPLPFKDIRMNVAYCGSVCMPGERKRCDKIGKCKVHLCEMEKRTVAKTSIGAEAKAKAAGTGVYIEYLNQRDARVEKWRRNRYKKCRGVRVIFEVMA